jgi:predicted nucleic acid-binding protein
VDTNLLVYLRDDRVPDKQRAAAEWMGRLWETRRGRLSTQVLAEYYVTVTVKLEPGLPAEEARVDVLALHRWLPRRSSIALMERAWEAQDRWGFSFWDAQIVAAAIAEGCQVLLTEDLSHGQDLAGLRVLDPFVVSPSEVLD